MNLISNFIKKKYKGCPPEIMGIGPYVAIPAVLKQVGLHKD